MKAILDFLKTLTGNQSTRKKASTTNPSFDVATAYDVVDNIGVATDSEKLTSSVGINLITSFEDLKLNAYDDGVGVWTIGFGTTIYPNGLRVKRGDRCTVEQAKSFFQQNLRRFEATVNQAVNVVINQNQFDALISLTYNIGQSAFKRSTLLKKLNAEDYEGAADQFLVWNRGGGEILRGLVRRRETERALFLKK
ncbi:lysozyme [Acinetobacter colistiniresistens]|uniref:Lysozyme n=1 Tax=Acinetobacter colistiniresistens TaxID=280145 RepID=S3T872_9GAMM|nr:lysozyme [Acinetobacter colistiniresistens]EPG37711.1 lysozyme [Acinetobacter colistiniresistens]TVT78964.1 lysozyme [Acinetobacter colistiniresistens]